MRAILVTLLLGSVTVFAGCFESGPALGEAKLVFFNHTDSLLCYTSSPASPGEGTDNESCARVKPEARSVWRPECRSGAFLNPGSYEKGGPTSVFLVVPGGAQIYGGFARCDEETGFLIEQNGGKFVVTKTNHRDSPTP